MSKNGSRLSITRLGLIWASACVLVILLPACEEPTPPPDPVTITFSYPAEGRGTDYYESLLEEFNERYPYITVDLRQEGWYDYDAFVDPEWWIVLLREQGNVRALDPFIEQDLSFELSDFYPSTVALFTADGEIWAIPAGTDMLVMYYNQDLFDQYGIPYPELGWTWDDFLTRALALRDEAAGTYGYSPWEGYLDACGFVYSHGGQLTDDIRNPTRTTYDDPLAVEAIEWYADLIFEHNVAPTPEQALSEYGIGDGDTSIGILTGKVGMWVAPLSSQGGDTYLPWKFRWGVVPLPRDARSATLVWGWGYAIRGEASFPEACWQWIAFLSEQRDLGLIPARMSIVESEEYEQLVRDDVAATIRSAMTDMTLVPFESVWAGNPDRMIRILSMALERIGEGRATAQEALSAAQEQADKVTAP